MTTEQRQAYETLLKHEIFFQIYEKDKYLPRAQEPAINEITAAYKVINPEFFKRDRGCQDCGALLITEANRARLWYLGTKDKPKKYKL